MMSCDDLHALIAQLRAQFEKVKSDKAFLALKQAELRSGDQISLYGFMDAHEQVKIEESLLQGHAFMIQQELAYNDVRLDRDSRRLLNEILRYEPGVL